MSTAEERADLRGWARDTYLADKVFALLDELEAAEEQANLFAALVEEYSAENTKLREALEFYADKDSHWGNSGTTLVDKDKGRRAREALEAKP